MTGQTNANGTNLQSELKDLQDKTKDALAKLENIHQDHFKMVTRNSVATYSQDTVDLVNDILGDFEKASSMARKIEKVVKNIRGPEPKLF